MTARFAALVGTLLALAVSSSAQDTPSVISGAPVEYPPYIYSLLAPSGVASTDPAISSSGSLELWLHDNLYMGHVKLTEIANFTMAHIHIGENATDGPVLNYAFPLYESGIGAVPRVSGIFRFPFTFSASLLNLTTLEEEGYYFNVHTLQYPSGEIRGQLISANESEIKASELKRRMH